MKVFIAETRTTKREALTARFKRHNWVIDAPEGVTDLMIARGEFDDVKDGGFDAIIGNLAAKFGQSQTLTIANDVGNFDVFSAQFAQANKHPTSHIGILICTQGQNRLSLDMLNNSVQVNGEDRNLSPMEHKLLRLLMLGANDAQDKETLAAKMGSTLGAMDVHLTRLRTKITPITLPKHQRGNLSLSSDIKQQNIIAQKHGITLYADRRITFTPNSGIESEIKPESGKNMLIDMLRGKRKATLRPNAKLMTYIRKKLATHSQCETAPQGYDFFIASDGHYSWRDTPLARKPKPKPAGMFFALGENGDLNVDTFECVLINTDTGDKLKLGKQEARFLEALTTCKPRQGLTGGCLKETHKIPSSNFACRVIRQKITKLGLNPNHYIGSGSAGNNSSGGYQLIGYQDLSHIFDNEIAPNHPAAGHLPTHE